MTTPALPAPLSTLVERLVQQHDGAATRADVTVCVTSAWDAVRYFGATDDPEMMTLAEHVAERELRLRLGLEREIARLDPEDHRRRSLVD